MKTVLGIMGGSGIYDVPELQQAQWVRVESPWGQPSDEVLIGEISGKKVVFLPRHGRGHVLSPSDINYRANIDVLKRCGVTDLVSISACGSLREDIPPGTFVVVDQFIDRTHNREKSFFGAGCVAHVSFADPVSPLLAQQVTATLKAQQIAHHQGGTYIAIEGPQFSTRAESNLYRSWGCDVIGMTNMPEARLAREAEICYVTVAMVTDYDCWHPEHKDVDLPQLIAQLRKNTAQARKLVVALSASLPQDHLPCPIGSDKALETAMITDPARWDPEVMAKVSALTRRVQERRQ